ncbi:MAG: hypothetical protein PF542_03965 [Nanoarchaeota archaeon]|jgi:2-dehydropantoate 2-reductase|nr:hypothetical protein [Nanoarchaeota archaeon]
MNVLVVGAGSIGVYLGVMLKRSGHNVVIIGREKLRKIHDSILVDDCIFEMSKRMYDFPKDGCFDCVFITSKLYDFEKNLKFLRQNGITSKYLISIQNGLVDNLIYEKYLKDYSFLTVSIFEGFRIVENQLMVSSSLAGWKTEDSLAGREISDLLMNSGINCSVDKNLSIIKAEKMVMNCSINVLCAIEKKTFYEMYNDLIIKERMDKIFDENYSVISKIVNIRSREKMRRLFYEVVSSMKHYSSTYQDAISGKITEIDFLNGYIIEKANLLNISVPENIKLLKEFKAMFK